LSENFIETIIRSFSDEEINLFVCDEQTGRLIFNGKALQALGIDPAEAQNVSGLWAGGQPRG
jgi:hypothetical protein